MVLGSNPDAGEERDSRDPARHLVLHLPYHFRFRVPCAGLRVQGLGFRV